MKIQVFLNAMVNGGTGNVIADLPDGTDFVQLMSNIDKSLPLIFEKCYIPSRSILFVLNITDNPPTVETMGGQKGKETVN